MHASNGLPLRVMTRKQEDSTPVGSTEIATLLGVARSTVEQWKWRGLLPEPRWTVGGRPAWAKSQIIDWAKETGRQINDPV